MNQENIIIESNSGQFSLTNRKIRFIVKSGGQLNVKSIMLNKISSIEVSFKSSYVYPIIALLSLIIGYFSGIENGSIFGLVFCMLFIVFYFVTMKRVIIISSPSVSIYLPIKKINNLEAIEFVDILEEQIYNY